MPAPPPWAIPKVKECASNALGVQNREVQLEKNSISVTAVNKNVRSSTRKVALVLDFIRGKKADVAIRDLEFTRKRIAHDVKKTVQSAVANAENNYQYDIDTLH